MKRILLAAAMGAVFAPAASAGMIERACLTAPNGGDRALCGCIQQVADMTLDRYEQRRAAQFFRDPHEAQVVKMSKHANDAMFWERYKRFGAEAERFCG